MWMTMLALRNAIAILMASLAVVVLGLVALERLPVDLFPNINLPIINVGTVYTGAGVLDVEKTVTYPIEKAVSAISDVKFVESKSRQGLSTVRVWMNWGAEINDGQTEVIQLLFIPLTFTISVSLFASFLVSRTVTPLLALKVLRPERSIDPASRSLRDRVFRFSRSFFERTEEVYQHIVVWALGHRRLVIGSIVVTFVASLFLVLAPPVGVKPLIGTEFFPPSDEAQFRVNIKAPIGTRVEETERIVKGMEAIIRATLRPEELMSIVSNVGIPQGRSAIFTSNTGPHSATAQVYLATADKRKRSDRDIIAA